MVVEKINGRDICIGGVGKLFYEQGFPISMSISELKKRNIECSIYHVADECLKNGWSAKTTYNKLKADFDDDIDKNFVDLDSLKEFCFADYETQRGMIFDYLFGNPPNQEYLKQFITEKKPT